MNTKEFCDQLRAAAEALAKGEREEIMIRDFDIENNLDEADQKKINSSYMRTVMNRVPRVRVIGTVKVQRIKDGIDTPSGYLVTLNRNPKRKVVTNDQIPEIKAQAVRHMAKRILNVQPRITDLEGEQLHGAAVAIERYRELIEEVVKELSE